MSNPKRIIDFCERESELDLTEALACARTQWLKSWLKDHLPEILPLTDTPEDHLIAQQWDAIAKQMMADRGLVTFSQQKNPLTDIRNAIKTIDPNHPTLQDVGFTAEEWEEINRPSEQVVSDHTTKFLTNPDAIVDKAIALLDSYDWYDLAAGLAVLTGRRCAEILKTATFEYKSSYSVTFTGAVKRRDETVPLVFEIPTLAPAVKIIESLAKLRDWVNTENMDNRAINNCYANPVIQSSDRHFQGLVPTRDGKDNLYTHLFRAVYATIACHWFCPPSVPELEFRAYIQGHFKILDEQNPELRRSLAAGRNYFDYKIADGQGNVDGRLGIKLTDPDVTVVEAFASYYQPTVPSISPVEPDSQAEPIRSPTVGDNDLLLDALAKMLSSSAYTVLLTGLMGVTGRTPAEILKSGVFKRADSDRTVLFSPTGLSTELSPLPTLVGGDAVLSAIAFLRKHRNVQFLLYLSPNQINAHCLRSVEK